MSLSLLLDKIRSQHIADQKTRPVVNLEDFFEGNHDKGSIGCNLAEHPGMTRFYEVLLGIRSRPDVQEVLVGITEDMGDEEYPFSDTVYVLTTASPDAIEEAAAPLQAEVVTDPTFLPPSAPTLAPNYKIVTLWWD